MSRLGLRRRRLVVPGAVPVFHVEHSGSIRSALADYRAVLEWARWGAAFPRGGVGSCSGASANQLTDRHRSGEMFGGGGQIGKRWRETNPVEDIEPALPAPECFCERWKLQPDSRGIAALSAPRQNNRTRLEPPPQDKGRWRTHSQKFPNKAKRSVSSRARQARLKTRHGTTAAFDPSRANPHQRAAKLMRGATRQAPASGGEALGATKRVDAVSVEQLGARQSRRVSAPPPPS